MDILKENYKENYNRIHENFEQELANLKIAYTNNSFFKYNEEVKATTKNGSKISGTIKVIDVDRNGGFQYYIFIDNKAIMYSNTITWFGQENLMKKN